MLCFLRAIKEATEPQPVFLSVQAAKLEFLKCPGMDPGYWPGGPDPETEEQSATVEKGPKLAHNLLSKACLALSKAPKQGFGSNFFA